MPTRILILTLTLYSFNLSGQNLINNSSFENGGSSIIWGEYPFWLSQVQNADDWESDRSGYSLDSRGEHSPDWFWSDNTKVHATSGGGTAIIQAQDQDGYVGMLVGELFEQKFNAVAEGDTYNLSFHVRRENSLSFSGWPSNSTFIDDTSISNDCPWLNNENHRINILLGKNKIKYQNSNATCDLEKTSEDVLLLASIPFSKYAPEIGIWEEISISFGSPGTQYDWIAFEFDSGCTGVGGFNYLLFDNINITASDCSSCSTCTPYDGCLGNVFSNNIHGVTGATDFVWWGVGNLENARDIDIEIFNITGQSVRSIFIPFIGDEFRFDGKSDSGIELAPSIYTYIVKVWNDCSFIELTGSFTKANAVGDPFPDPDPIYTTSNPLPDEECCSECIYINNYGLPNGENYVIDENINIISTGKVIIGPNVTILSGVTVTIEAANQIILTPDVIVESGANVVKILGDCN